MKNKKIIPFEEYFDCSDDLIYNLVAEICRSAIIDYMAEVPPITQGMSKDRMYRAKAALRNKKTAEAFFKKSRLFKVSQISFDYLLQSYKDGKIITYGDRKKKEDK